MNLDMHASPTIQPLLSVALLHSSPTSSAFLPPYPPCGLILSHSDDLSAYFVYFFTCICHVYTSEGVPSVLSADFNNGDQSAQPPSIAQAFLRGLLGRIEERGHELQQTYEDTGITEDDPAMERYMLATQHLHVAQQTAISLSAPLAMAEHHLEGFKAAVDNTHENAVETALVGESHQEPHLFVVFRMYVVARVERGGIGGLRSRFRAQFCFFFFRRAIIGVEKC